MEKNQACNSDALINDIKATLSNIFCAQKPHFKGP